MKTILIALMFTLASCASSRVDNHQYPYYASSSFFPRSCEIYLDQSGDFWPYNTPDGIKEIIKNWSYPGLTVKGLYEEAELKYEAHDIAKEVIDKVGEESGDCERVIILIHGINNSENMSRTSFSELRSAMAKNKVLKNDDYVINLHWDGLTRTRFWWNACGYSQMAGIRGLRNLFAKLANKSILVIAHSRGTSVVLSALHDPCFSPNFELETKKLHGINVRDAIEVPEIKDLTVVAFAPACGWFDFLNKSYSGKVIDVNDPSLTADKFQRFRFISTINNRDPVLNKYFLKSGSFNSTEFGCNDAVALDIYTAMKESSGIVVEPVRFYQNNHELSAYLKSDQAKKVWDKLKQIQ